MKNNRLPNNESMKPRINLIRWFTLVGHLMLWGSFLAVFASVLIGGQTTLNESGYQGLFEQRLSWQYFFENFGFYTITMIFGFILLFVFRNGEESESQ